MRRVSSRTVQQAAAQTAAMLPVQTFVACDKNDKCAVGVLISKKNSTFNLISTIQKYGSQFRPNPDMPDTFTQFQEDIYDGKEFPSTFGVRLMYDAEGYPVFVSFGQSSVSRKGGEAFYSENYEVAKTFAEGMATMYLGTLWDSYTNYDVDAQVTFSHGITEVKEKNVCENKEDKREITQNDLDKQLGKYVQMKSNTVLPGILPIYEWHKDFGQSETVGVVIMWSPKTALAGENMRNRKAVDIQANAPRTTGGNQDVDHAKPFVSEGINLDVYDF